MTGVSTEDYKRQGDRRGGGGCAGGVVGTVELAGIEVELFFARAAGVSLELGS